MDEKLKKMKVNYIPEKQSVFFTPSGKIYSPHGQKKFL